MGQSCSSFAFPVQCVGVGKKPIRDLKATEVGVAHTAKPGDVKVVNVVGPTSQQLENAQPVATAKRLNKEWFHRGVRPGAGVAFLEGFLAGQLVQVGRQPEDEVGLVAFKSRHAPTNIVGLIRLAAASGHEVVKLK